MKKSRVILSDKPKSSVIRQLGNNILKHPLLYIMALPVILYYILYHYYPMYGMLIAFFDYAPMKGILGSDFVGMKHFKAFLQDPYFFRTVWNTLSINIKLLVFAFPFPIIFAILINELTANRFRKFIQTVTYMPHFISTVVICGLVLNFCSSTGVITSLISSVTGMEPTNLMSKVSLFQPIYVLMIIWQEFGWDSIIFYAALTGIDQSLYEAATVDGAGRWAKIRHITLPGLAPTIIILLILRIGNMMSLGWDRIILLYNPMIYESADVISTYVYRRGLLKFEYSFASAVGFFNSIINFILLIGANAVSRKINDTSLW
ncbi:ABC transporter permease [Eisenbergiella tayi]|uniref:ABC transporter permease n=1 Tax=Eisenbergiella tayi TaxID=1432052 RepID=UPI00084896FF|nr:ABC transporter permease subunit [Eisenbergiella tayi]ODR43330.1 sugar ABC transporter permease [Eisenbergiella tayi]